MVQKSLHPMNIKAGMVWANLMLLHTGLISLPKNIEIFVDIHRKIEDKLL
jgi:hypothetical protein